MRAVSTKKRALINLGLTLCLLVLVTLKLIRWHIHEIDLSWVFQDFLIEPSAFLINLFIIEASYGIFLSAVLALITIWLPLKTKTTFAALCVSGGLGLVELGSYVFIKILGSLSGKPFSYTGFDPLLTAGAVAVIGFKYRIVHSKKNNNQNQ